MVRLEQAAQELLALDLADGAVGGRWDDFTSVEAGRDSIADPLMRPVRVVEALEAPHNTAQALDAKQDEVVQTLLTGAPEADAANSRASSAEITASSRVPPGRRTRHSYPSPSGRAASSRTGLSKCPRRRTCWATGSVSEPSAITMRPVPLGDAACPILLPRAYEGRREASTSARREVVAGCLERGLAAAPVLGAPPALTQVRLGRMDGFDGLVEVVETDLHVVDG